MAENQTPGTSTPPADPGGEALKNIKAEMERKFQNVTDTLKQTTEALKQQLATITKPAAPPPAPKPSASFKDKFYEDEDAALHEVKEQAKSEIRAELQANQRQTEVLNRLYVDYPEIGDAQHALTKRAVEIYESLPKHERENPISYRAAVLDAATELGVQPVKKRQKQATDDYTGGGGNSHFSTGGRTKDGELDPRTHAFAALVGLNVEDPKVMESLKKRAGRTNWNTYE